MKMRLLQSSIHCHAYVVGCLYLTEGVETHDHREEHCEKMCVPVKALHVFHAAVFAAHFCDFGTVWRFYQLTIHRLSEKMCTFAHDYLCFMYGDYKDNQMGRHDLHDSPIFLYALFFNGQ